MDDVNQPLIQLTDLQQKKFQFIANLTQFANVASACRIAGFSRRTAYNHKKKDVYFSQCWDDAIQEYHDNFEAAGRLFALEQKDSRAMLAYLKCINPKYSVKPMSKAQAVREMAAAQPTKAETDATEDSSHPGVQFDYSRLTLSEREKFLELAEKCAV